MVYVTGHSLGAGMAHLFAFTLAAKMSPVARHMSTLYTFAQPRIGDEKFAAMSDSLLRGAG